MRRLMNVLLAAAGVLVVASAVYVVTNNDAPAQSERRSSTPPPDPTTPAVEPTKPPKKPKPLVVAFLGDDWTAGTGASTEKRRFTTLVSDDLHLLERNFGADGTGYAKATADDGDYTARVDDLVATHPDVVVVSGGRNDASNLLATVASRARALFHELHAALPHATLIAVAPMWGDSDTPPEVRAIGNAVKQAVTDAGGTYLDVADPIHDHPKLMANEGDPNDGGYAAIAAALAPKLKALLPD